MSIRFSIILTLALESALLLPAKPSFAAETPGPLLVGRFLKDDKGYHFKWAGTRIIAQVKGVKLVKIGLSADDIGTQKISFNVYIDGKIQSKFITLTDKTPLYVTDLPDTEEHRIEWVKRTDPSAEAAAVNFVGIAVPSGGKILPVADLPPRWIEVIGGPLSQGQGTLPPLAGVLPAVVCPSDSSAQDSNAAFASVAARMLDAKISLLSTQAASIVKLLDYDYESGMPDVMIVEGDTKDFAGLVRSIRMKLPQVLIVPVLGPMKSALDGKKLLASIKDPKILTPIDFGSDAGPGQTCGGYPSAATHKKMATQLAKVLAEKLGWTIAAALPLSPPAPAKAHEH